MALLSIRSQAQALDLNPTRPTVANSAAIQGKGVLQVEVGFDTYPHAVPGRQDTLGLLTTYVPLERLRVDFGWSPYAYRKDEDEKGRGVGTIQIGAKVVLEKERNGHAAPGLALQYEAELPTASDQALQGYGQQVTMLLNHHYGKGGIVDVMLNGSLVQSDCQDATGCAYGGQQSAAVSYHLNENTRLYSEVFGQNKGQSNTPPGTYVFTGFYRKLRDSVGIDGGMRFGVTNHSARVGVTLAMVFGRRLQGDSASK
ncbi:transporter [Terriglobus roseus]|uniref:transporter n=1 Tax=Terriglobus roseus TaxID=392734 RepID=UPI001E59D407|nr:transporter [Terriglobus roseus]